MDVSEILAAQEAKRQAVTVEKDIPLDIDTGLLTVTDLTPIDAESYEENLEDYLTSTARDGVQALIGALFSLPTTPSPDGPLAQLPPPTTQLPRAKPLPKPKPLTKWEKFAREKGIQKKKEKKVWDEEKQEWVNRWGWKGANKDKETQWLSEVPANADVDYDPRVAARAERKAKMAKNERHHEKNLARAQAELGISPDGVKLPQSERKRQIDRTLATTRTSTASMGKFDKTLEGEKKLKGVKRKFDPTEVSSEKEKSTNLAILSKLDREPVAKKSKSSGDSMLNVRKAVRAVSGGKGSTALAHKASVKGRKGKR